MEAKPLFLASVESFFVFFTYDTNLQSLKVSYLISRSLLKCSSSYVKVSKVQTFIKCAELHSSMAHF